jgi:hypothetical protein
MTHGDPVAELDPELALEEADVADQKRVSDFADDDRQLLSAFSISSYGADYTIDSLVKRVRNGDFFVPPFQRAFVWNLKQSSRFIESLLMGLPVPGVFVFREASTNRHLIIDGQQRLKSLSYFYSGRFPKGAFPGQPQKEDKVFRLDDVRSPWADKTYDELDDASRRRLDDSVIHTTIFRQDSPENDGSVYEVFERINTGGVKLSPQEIRICVNFGKFTNLLNELNNQPSWRKIYGPLSPRLKDQELILRFFAFYDKLNDYERPLRGFLNKYMESKKALSDEESTILSKRFAAMAEAVLATLGPSAFRPERILNTAVFDAVSVAIARRLEKDSTDLSWIQEGYRSLMNNDDFKQTYTRATADEESVRARFKLATEAFQ